MFLRLPGINRSCSATPFRADGVVDPAADELLALGAAGPCFSWCRMKIDRSGRREAIAPAPHGQAGPAVQGREDGHSGRAARRDAALAHGRGV